MVRLWAVRPVWRTVGDGEFFCGSCGGDRAYRLRRGREWLWLLGVPLLPLRRTGPVVECGRGHRHEPEALTRPTCAELTALLRDATRELVRSVLLALGERGERAVRREAEDTLRAAGCLAEERAASAESLPELLIALADGLEPLGRRALVARAARIAAAAGTPYGAPERALLTDVGGYLGLGVDDVRAVLEEVAGSDRLR